MTLRCESTSRGETAEGFSRSKMKARGVVGRGEKSLLRDPGSELRLLSREGEGGRKSAEMVVGMSKKEK